MGDLLHHPVPQLADGPGDAPLQLGRCILGGGGALGVDQVAHRLYLSQVQLARQKGPPGEFTGLGRPGPQLAGPV